TWDPPFRRGLSPGKESLTRLPHRRFPDDLSPRKPIPSDMSPGKPPEPFCIPCGRDKQTTLRSKDLLSFCSNAGVEVRIQLLVHTIERTQSMSELNLACMLESHMLDEVAAF
nr:hypothetical protein [Tanacetum cinerariifolium]